VAAQVEAALMNQVPVAAVDQKALQILAILFVTWGQLRLQAIRASLH
jgi:hypothetical protein